MQTIAIIGGGVSGLTLGKLLSKSNNVTIYETDSKPGGLIKCRRVNGSLFHTCGGHVFNTRNPQVLNFFWSMFERDKEFCQSDRNSIVMLPSGLKIPYPIENYIYLFPNEILRAIISDIINLPKENRTSHNFREFLEKQFGKTLFEIYFKPYNEKIWKSDLSQIPLSWLDGKLPMPTPNDIIFNNIRRIEEKEFVHSTFWYECHNGSQFIADKMAEGLNIYYNSHINRILRSSDKWEIDGTLYDKVIFCGNLRELPFILTDLDLKRFSSEIAKLKSHGTTSVFCEIDNNPFSWIYLPDPKFDAHRIICTGNFSKTNNAVGKLTGTVEFTDEISVEELSRQLPLLPLNPKYIAHQYNPLTYPIQSENTRKMIQELKSFLEPYNIFLCGRFAEWEYFNMDKAMESAINLSDAINKKL